MKRSANHLIISICCLTIALLTGCRSAQTPQQAAMKEAQKADWENLYMPIRVDIEQPVQYSLNGRATMVRNQSIYLSLRTFGMEVGAIYATPADALLAMKLPSKAKIQLPIAEILADHGIRFTDIQDALLGSRTALEKLPKSVKWSVDNSSTRTVVSLSTIRNGRPISLSITWYVDAAEWNIAEPRQFTIPGDDYRTLDLEAVFNQLMNQL